MGTAWCPNTEEDSVNISPLSGLQILTTLVESVLGIRPEYKSYALDPELRPSLFGSLQ